MSEQQVYVFNQYYIDFLKKVKSFAKEQKESKKNARDILRAIKKHYASMDKMTNEYIDFLKAQGFWEAYHALEDKKTLPEEFQDKLFYKDIDIGQLVEVIPNPFLLHHFLCIMDIFLLDGVPVEKTIDAIKSLNNPTEFASKLEELSPKKQEGEGTGEEGTGVDEPSPLKTKLLLLHELHMKQNRVNLDSELKEIENTSLGKLAKEIMGDINVDELQKTLMDSDNILGSLQNPDSGFGKILSTVSQKMISKMASGELNQDNLLQDAMSLATKLPAMMPNGMAGLGSQLGNLGAMFQNMGFNPNDLMKTMGGLQKNPRMESAHRKHKATDRLKKKLQRQREENNVSGQVENTQ